MDPAITGIFFSCMTLLWVTCATLLRDTPLNTPVVHALVRHSCIACLCDAWTLFSSGSRRLQSRRQHCANTHFHQQTPRDRREPFTTHSGNLGSILRDLFKHGTGQPHSCGGRGPQPSFINALQHRTTLPRQDLATQKKEMAIRFLARHSARDKPRCKQFIPSTLLTNRSCEAFY